MEEFVEEMPSGNREFSPITVSGTEDETRGEEMSETECRNVITRNLIYMDSESKAHRDPQHIKVSLNTSKILGSRCGHDLTGGFPVKTPRPFYVSGRGRSVIRLIGDLQGCGVPGWC